MENNNINNAANTAEEMSAVPDEAAKEAVQETAPETETAFDASDGNGAPDRKKLSDRDVTAHTAAMWKYKPVPESPEPYPESVSGSASDGGFSVTAASVRGKKHKHDGSNRDDSFAFEIVDDMAIAAVSDGAGSKAFSRIGAKAACEAVIKYSKIRLEAIKRDFPDFRRNLGGDIGSADFGNMCSQIAEMLRGSCAEAFAAVEAAAEKREKNSEFEAAVGRKPELKDFSCTLLAAAFIPVETKNGREYLTASIQVGDGMIAAIDESAEAQNALIILGDADSGSFAGETEFITSEQFRNPESLMSRTKVRRGRLTSFLMMTDGVADDYYPNNPQLLRLALDLKLNGIMPAGKKVDAGSADTAVPEPVSYPWVNDGDVLYALQYTKNVLSETGLTLGDFWKNKALQKKASLSEFGIVHEKDRAEMLTIWLDNYVERGSFDDRTLLMINTEN